SKVQFKLTKQVYQHVFKKNGTSSSSPKKKVGLTKQEASSSNPFDALNTVENDDEPAKINDLERQMLDGKLMLVDDDGKPLKPSMKKSLSTLHFLKFPYNSFEVLKLLENSVEVLKILENKLESMKILENKLELLKLHENQPLAVNSSRDRGVEAEPRPSQDRAENEPKSWTLLERHEKAFYTGLTKFVDDCKPAKEELYPSCDYVTRLEFMEKFTYFKVKVKLTDSIFNEMLEFFQHVFPTMKGYKLPPSYYAIKKTFKMIGLGYESIHACVNDCFLFRGDNNKDVHLCPVCKTSRWKDSNTPGKKVPKKVLHYFPIIPRLQRLYKSSHAAKEMTWHATGKCTEPGKMQHPVDGRAWKNFDTKYPNFAKEPRNVQLGLTADGFNSFGNLSQAYSMWPVILTTYNLPTWLCMKESYFMLTLLIPSLKSPGKDINVYLRPLIDDLKVLWALKGVETIDVATRQKFNTRAMVLWTINDFPTQSSLSVWSGKGYKACPTCNETLHLYVYNDPGVSATIELFALACGPTPTPILVNSCLVNGVMLIMHSHDERGTTQNSGIVRLVGRTEKCIMVVEHVNHKKFLDWGVIVVEEVPDVIHFDNLSDLPLFTSLNDLDNVTLHIDDQSTKIDAPPDSIDLDEDDDIIDDENAFPYDLAYSDDEDLVNVDDDDGVDVFILMLHGATTVTVVVMIVPLHTIYLSVARVAVVIKGLHGEVIVNGDAPVSITSVSGGAEAAIPPKTTEQKIARRNELKAKSTLLLAILDEYLLKFPGINDAKTLWEATNTRFGSNKESKKMQKTILKKQYENFASSTSEGRCKSEVAEKSTTSLEHSHLDHPKQIRSRHVKYDDLYINLKVSEADIKGQSNLSSNSQNVAFVSLDNTSSTNEAVNTTHDVFAASSQRQDFALTYDDDVMFFFFANQSNSPQLDNEDLEQIDTNDLDQISPKYKTGLSYDSQLNERYLNNKSDVFESASDSSVNKSEEDNNQANDRLDDFVFKSAINETMISMHETEISTSKTSKESMEKPKSVRPSAPIIEDWESDNDDDDCEIRCSIEQNKPMITNSGKVPVNTTKQSFLRAAASTSTAIYINTAATRPTVNDAKPNSNVFHKSHSPVRRTFNQRTTPKNSDLKETINTAKVNNVTTARTKAVVSVVQGNGENAMKSSACWIWRPTGNVIDHISKDSRLYMLKRFNYVDLQGRLSQHTLTAVRSKLMLLCINLQLLVMVTTVGKPTEFEGFEQIVDFLNANPIKYALTVNLAIYTSCIQQFWDSAKVITVNEDVQIRALVYGKKIIIIEASIRRDL
nr:hypothetical protein [Tanacetum cinerariifolium]